MRELFGHVNDVRRPQWSLGLKLNLPPEYLLIHRVWIGGIGVLCQIEGEVPVLQVLAEWLPEFDVEALDYIEFVDEADDASASGAGASGAGSERAGDQAIVDETD